MHCLYVVSLFKSYSEKTEYQEAVQGFTPSFQADLLTFEIADWVMSPEIGPPCSKGMQYVEAGKIVPKWPVQSPVQILKAIYGRNWCGDVP